MTKRTDNSLARLIFCVFMTILIAITVWTVSPVDYVKAAPDTWRVVSPMTTARADHTAVLLQNGRVIVMGGSDSSSTYASTEIYDPYTNIWQNGPPMSSPRAYHSATLLLDGRVLVAGGQGGGFLSSAEIYDPVSNTWAAAASMNAARQGHTATLLPDGKVLVAGGMSSTGYQNTAEIYSPDTDTWTSTVLMAVGRFRHCATMLPDGKVLITGGAGTTGYLTGVEIFDPTLNTWSVQTSMSTARAAHTANLLNDGTVVVIGGQGTGSSSLNSVERFDPATNTWAPVNNMITARYSHSTTLLPNGNLIVAGGWDSTSGARNSVEVFTTSTGLWSSVSGMAFARSSHTALLLTNGNLLVVGGSGNMGSISAVEVFDSAHPLWTNTGSISTNRTNPEIMILADGNPLLSGGSAATGIVANADIYNSDSGIWNSTGSMTTPRDSHTLTLLPNGHALAIGGSSYPGNYLNSSEYYQTDTGTWSASASMTNLRRDHTATLLGNGLVLVAGGRNVSGASASCELYDPVSNTWQATGSLLTARYYHKAVLLKDSRVLVMGGYGTSYLSSAEIYNPETGTWSATGSMTSSRQEFTLTLLPDGRVLAAGGYNGGYLATAELFDPALATWSATSTMVVPRRMHTATLLPDGRVLVAGGLQSITGYLSSAFTYDPTQNLWSVATSMNTSRRSHAAALLPNGEVLVVGGYNGSYLTSAEVFNVGLGFDEQWRPTVYDVDDVIYAGGTLTIAGTNFRGHNFTDTSFGSSQASPANYPLVQLRRLDNEETQWINVDSFDQTSLDSLAIGSINAGPAVVTVFVNGIPSRLEAVLIGLPSITLSSATYSIAEDGASVTIAAHISGERSGDITVDYATTDGTAVAGSDYTATSGTLTFAPTDTEKTFSVPILDDAIYEGDETFTVTLSNPSGAVLDTPFEAIVTITDDDPLPGHWTEINSLGTGRSNHTATLLTSGKVLVAGGYNGGYLRSAELYNPSTGTWTYTGAMATTRRWSTATLLPDGKVLMVGGYNGSYLSNTEIYNPHTGTWNIGLTMAIARRTHTATLLPDGKVLVAGGQNVSGYLSGSELFDPLTGEWTVTGSMITPRGHHDAILLADGRVLVAGGFNYDGSYLNSAEIYDPATGIWTSAGNMNSVRWLQTATLLPNGKVLLAGGQNSTSYLSDTELYNPLTATWDPTGIMITARRNHTATLLPDGKVLVGGGLNSSGHLRSAELYDPLTGIWTITDTINAVRSSHTATMLPNGTILVVGGYNGSSYLSSAELYEPTGGSWANTSPITTGRSYHTATLISNGKVLVAGGNSNTGQLTSAMQFDPVTATWSSAANLNNARSQHTATLLFDETVLVAGGLYSGHSIASAEVFQPTSNTWVNTGSMITARRFHATVLLPNSEVLVVGGYDFTSVVLASAELYNPETGTWRSAGSMNIARIYHSATLLPDGKVLVTGGQSQTGGSYLINSELYDPLTGTWTNTGSMNTARTMHTATLLPDGKILVAGGFNGSYLNSSEVYDPSSGTWTVTGTMNNSCIRHKAILLADGNVLIMGGYRSGWLSSAEIYHPALGIWVSTASLNTSRQDHTATFLSDGKVLVVGGQNSLSSAELYDPELGYESAWQPTITSVTSPASLGASMTIGGTGFRGYGYTEASSGGTQSSPTNYPLLQLRHLDSGQTIWLSTSGFTATSFTSVPLSGINPGPTLLTVFVNGIPSFSQMIIVTPPPVITLSSATYSVAEDGGNVTITAQIIGARSSNVTVDFATSDGTALAGSDYTATSGTLTFTPTDTEQTFTVPILDDVIYEGDETFTVSLSNPLSAVLDAPTEATVTITDEDPLPLISFSTDAYSVSEEGGNVIITAQISGTRAMDVTVDYATTDGTALAGSDYTATNGTLTFTPTDTEKTFTVPILDDANYEGDETFSIALSNPTNSSLGDPASVMVTINDDDPLPEIVLSSDTYSVSEDGVSVTITAQISGARSMNVTVDYATADGTAVAGSDYTTTSGTLTFTSTDTEKNLTVTILDNAIYEGDETFSIALSNPINSTLGDPASATVTINDDDSMPEIVLSSETYSVDEDGVSVTITAQISGDRSFDATVDYATVDGTALAGSDYTATSGTLTFAPTDTEKTFTIPILDDAIYEGDEAFTVTLSNPSNATLGTPSMATVTITDDDSMPEIVLSSETYSVDEDGISVTITAQISGARAMDVTIDYASSDGTALAGNDYTATSGTLTFTPTDAEITFTIPILDDAIYEGDETFSISIFDPIFAALGDPASAIVTITDDDLLAEIVLSNDTYSVDEDGVSVTITAQISGERAMDVTVDYATGDGTALAGNDYTAGSGTITFTPTDAELTFSVPILDDAVYEGDEAFTVTLSNPSNATLGTPSTATVTIVENDEAVSDLALVLTDTPDPVFVGGEVTYTITVENLGPQDAIAVEVTDTLPDGVEYLSASDGDWSCEELSGVVTCQLASLANGASSQLQILVRAPQVAGEITNSAQVSSSIADTNLDNNQETETTIVEMRKIYLPIILR